MLAASIRSGAPAVSRRGADNDVAREIAVLKKLDHPNIVKLAEVCRARMQTGSRWQTISGSIAYHCWIPSAAAIAHRSAEGGN